MRRALRWAIDGSASPMETNTALLLCLPPLEGGYGFELPTMNAMVGAGLRQRSVTRRSCYRCDLFWERGKVAVEYDSDLWHTGAERIASDSARRNALAAMGITVVDVTRLQINDLAEFDRIAHVLARLLGKTLRRPSAKQMRKRVELHRATLFAARA